MHWTEAEGCGSVDTNLRVAGEVDVERFGFERRARKGTRHREEKKDNTRVQ